MTGTMQISWGIELYKADATTVYNEIQSIGKEVKPNQIVEFAKANPESELHKCFTWDDRLAAEKCRIIEARDIVRQLKITYISNETKEPIQVRAMYITEKGGNYKPTPIIVEHADERVKLLETAMQELRMFEAKYHNLVEFTELFEVIHNL